MNQSIPLALQQVLHRNTRGFRHHPRNVIGCDPIMQHRQRRLDVLLPSLAFRRKLPLQFGDGREAQSARNLEMALPL